MRGQLCHRFTTAVVTLALAGGVAVAVAYSGVVDVAADGRSSGLTRWFLTTTRDHAIASRAQKIAVQELTSTADIAIGGQHYREMCQGCHGGPGLRKSEIQEGLDPPPPELWTGSFGDEDAREAFWVIKNGIRMTGMPAFGPSHDDEKIWSMVAFVRKMHGMSPAEYAQAPPSHVAPAPTNHEETQEQPAAAHQ